MRGKGRWTAGKPICTQNLHTQLAGVLRMLKTACPSCRETMIDHCAGHTTYCANAPHYPMLVCRAQGKVDTVPAKELLEQEKFIMRDFIVEERWRGLSWLTAATFFAIWITGVLNKDSPLAP